MEIIEQLKNYSKESKLAIIIRHGERDNIPSGEHGNEVLLNKKGEEDSLRFGKLLQPFQVNRILTSPIKRCVQTAEFISRGYGKDIEITQTSCLGAPGLHIIDEKQAGDYFLKQGCIKALEDFIEGRTPQGLRNKTEFYRVMTQFIHSETKNKGLTIYVTHDSLIALYHFCFDQTIYTPDNWVKYLGGLIINVSENE